MSKERATVKDVARAAGVTAQTVSRVYRGVGYVAEATRANVLEAAKKLNYIPNLDAISLRVGTPDSIAVVFDSLLNVYFSIMIDYLHRELKARGYKLVTIFVGTDHLITKEIYLSTISTGVKAIISFLEADEGLGKIVKAYGVPVVVFGRRAEESGIDYVTTNDEQGGRLAAERLLQDNCRRVAFIAEGIGLSCVQDRFKGFRERLVVEGIEPQLIDIADGLEDSLDRLREEGFEPNGAFCFSDMIAFEVIRVTRERNVPMKIIGYDDLRAEVMLPIHLTSIGLDKGAYIKFMVDRLLTKLEQADRDTCVLAERVDVQIREGETA